MVTLHSPQTHKELFSYRHVRLWNVIECIFRVIKCHFRVLIITQEYSFETQSWLVSGLEVLHNFIYFHDPTNTLEEDLAKVEPTHQDPSSTNQANLHEWALSNEKQERAAECREAIVFAMWWDYQHKRQHRSAHS